MVDRMSIHNFPTSAYHHNVALQAQAQSQPCTPAATGPSSTSTGSTSNAAPSSPNASVNPVPAFDFPVPALPPRLSKVGRRISEFGNSVLFPEDDTSRRGSRDTPSTTTKPPPHRHEVPGMGDEPVMCPFCNKPLPPALFDAHRPHATAPPTRQSTGAGTGAQTPEKRGSLASLRGLGIKTGELTRSLSIGPGLAEGALMSAGAVGAGTGVSPGYASQRSSITKTLVEEPTDLTAAPTASADGAPAAAGAGAGKGTLLESAEVVPKATAESFQPTLKAAENADTAAARTMISKDEIRRWLMVAGMPVSPEAAVQSVSVAPDQPATAPAGAAGGAPAKSIPALPPPPPPASKLVKPTDRTESPGGSSRFGFFKSGKSKADEDDEESDDDAPASGYARLTGAASPDKDFEEEDPMERIGKAKAAASTPDDKAAVPAPPDGAADAADKKKDHPVETPKVEPPATPAAPSNAANESEVKGTLQEVIGKVNAMNKAHEDIIHSHATLLTQLKIARSNLAMAEANTEMLEEQLKRSNTRRASGVNNTPSAVIATPGGTTALPPSALSISPGVPRRSLDVPPKLSATKSTGAVPTTTSLSSTVKPAPSPAAPQRGSNSLEAARPVPVVSPQPRRPAEAPEGAIRPRPNTLIMPPPNPNNNGPATSVAGENKGWSFWQGGKKKVPGLGNMKFTLPSADQIFDAIENASRPPTPGAERSSLLGTSAPTSAGLLTSPTGAAGGALPDPLSPPARGTSTVNSPSLNRSTSSSAVVSPAMHGKAPMSPPDYMTEMNRMRQAQISNQARIEAMSKELTELRKGKVDMEAELENLSQALFEEANKMVADERRKRAEVEETLKEIKEEREALRQTVKLLNGQPEGDVESIKAPSIKLPEDDELPEEFVPRDLDKHYEALRKTIHHVGESAAPSSDSAGAAAGASIFANAVTGTEYGIRQFENPISPVPEAAEVELNSDGGSPGRPRARSISAPSSPNPWANAGEPMTGGGGLALGEDVDPLDSTKVALSFGQVGVTPPIGDVGPTPAPTKAAQPADEQPREKEEEPAKDNSVKGLGLKLSPTPPNDALPPAADEGADAKDGAAKLKTERKLSHEDELDRLMGDLAKVM